MPAWTYNQEEESRDGASCPIERHSHGITPIAVPGNQTTIFIGQMEGSHYTPLSLPSPSPLGSKQSLAARSSHATHPIPARPNWPAPPPGTNWQSGTFQWRRSLLLPSRLDSETEPNGIEHECFKLMPGHLTVQPAKRGGFVGVSLQKSDSEPRFKHSAVDSEAGLLLQSHIQRYLELQYPLHRLRSSMFLIAVAN